MGRIQLSAPQLLAALLASLVLDIKMTTSWNLLPLGKVLSPDLDRSTIFTNLFYKLDVFRSLISPEPHCRLSSPLCIFDQLVEYIFQPNLHISL